MGFFIQFWAHADWYVYVYNISNSNSRESIFFSLPSVNSPSLRRLQEMNLFKTQQIFMEYLITFPPWYLDDVPVNASAGNGALTLFIGQEAKHSLCSNPEVQAAKWLMWKSENPKTS